MLYQPFDMPMAHIKCHDEGATIDNTELVVFRKSHPSETRAAFWQRIVRDSEDRAAVEAKESNSVDRRWSVLLGRSLWRRLALGTASLWIQTDR